MTIIFDDDCLWISTLLMLPTFQDKTALNDSMKKGFWPLYDNRTREQLNLYKKKIKFPCEISETLPKTFFLVYSASYFCLYFFVTSVFVRVKRSIRAFMLLCAFVREKRPGFFLFNRPTPSSINGCLIERYRPPLRRSSCPQPLACYTILIFEKNIKLMGPIEKQ